MKNALKCFIFSLSKASYPADDIAIIAESRAAAEIELRVLGIIYCGGVSFEFRKELG